MTGQTSDVHFRPDHLAIRRARREERADDRLMAHYRLERSLAAALAAAPAAERSRVYQSAYDTLFRELPDHPQHRAGRASVAERVQEQLRFLRPFLSPGQTWLEIGCGDAALSFAVAAQAEAAFGLDVTGVLVDTARAPANFRFVQTGGTDIALPDGSIDLAYSNQLLEHLHRDDVPTHLREVRRVLRAGGRYVCRTPSRVTGPHDISAYFDYHARGFHLVEYDHASITAAFRAAGFARVQPVLHARGRHVMPPLTAARLFDAALTTLPVTLRARLARIGAVAQLAGLAVVASA